MTQRIPHPASPTEVRQAFQQLASQSDVITTGASGEILIGAGVGVTPEWGTSLTSLTRITVDSITIDAATIISATGAISFGNESLTTTGTIAGINVTSGADPGHTHTGASLGTIDISDDTNLAVTAPIVLTDDTLSLNQAGIDHGTIGGLMDDDHTIYLLATGTRDLTGNLAVDDGITIDSRDLSVDGAKLDLIEAEADKTDATNVTAAGAAMAGGAFHDGFSDFLDAEHVSLPNTITNVLSDHNLAAHTGLGLFDSSGDVDHNATANTHNLNTDLDFDGLAAATPIVAADTIPFHDETAVGNRKVTFANFESSLSHNSLGGYVANEHIDHTGVSMTTAAGSGLSGGGDISSTRTLVLNINGLTGESGIVAADTIPFYDDGVGNRKITLTELATALGAADEKVKVDVGATAGYLGVAAGDGVLRTNGTIAWTDGGNFVTLALSHLGIEDLSDAGADKILFWDDGASATAWLAVTGTGKGIVTTNLEINSGYVDRGDPSGMDRVVGDFTQNSAWHELDLGPDGLDIVPAGAYAVKFGIFMQTAAAGKEVYFRKYGNSQPYNAARQYSYQASSMFADFIVACDSGGSIDYWMTTAGWTQLNFVVHGWYI